MKILITFFIVCLSACGGPQKTGDSTKEAIDTVTSECPCGKADLDTPPPPAPTETTTAQ